MKHAQIGSIGWPLAHRRVVMRTASFGHRQISAPSHLPSAPQVYLVPGRPDVDLYPFAISQPTMHVAPGCTATSHARNTST